MDSLEWTLESIVSPKPWLFSHRREKHTSREDRLSSMLLFMQQIDSLEGQDATIKIRFWSERLPIDIEESFLLALGLFCEEFLRAIIIQRGGESWLAVRVDAGKFFFRKPHFANMEVSSALYWLHSRDTVTLKHYLMASLHEKQRERQS